MKPHPGIRKTIKWGGALVTLLLLVVWIHDIREFMITGGEPRHRGLWRWMDLPGVCGLPPLIGVFTIAATLTAWRLDVLARRRARIGLCAKCHYDRAGLAASTVCPECGTAPVDFPQEPPV